MVGPDRLDFYLCRFGVKDLHLVCACMYVSCMGPQLTDEKRGKDEIKDVGEGEIFDFNGADCQAFSSSFFW